MMDKKRERVIAVYEVVKRWVTGENDEHDEEDIHSHGELKEQVLMQIHLSRTNFFHGIRNLPTYLES
jgi:hypothetical protein